MRIAKPEGRAIFADEPNIRPWSDLGRCLPLFFAAALSLALAALLYFVSQAGRERDEALASQRHSFLVMKPYRPYRRCAGAHDRPLASIQRSTTRSLCPAGIGPSDRKSTRLNSSH